ncbi:MULTISPECIES: YciI family protein [unclassified Microbacterium]|uniref:YciI family protein n=1 Tax=unclassified Microbacterium TaxID=2609290 RepID=UPI003019FA1C
MTQYIIYFNQQWVGDHTPEWFASRGPLANAVVSQMRDAGVLVFAAGVDEDPDAAITADISDGSATIVDGLYAPEEQYIGGLTIVDVADEEEAKLWGGRLAEACGWPQQIRRVY